LNFPLATSAGTTRQVYFFSGAAQTPTTAGFISVRYVDGSNRQDAPNTVVVNGQTITAISKGYWEVNSTATFPNAFGMGINSYGMFNATNPALLRPVLGSNGTPTTISVPSGTWTGSGNFPSYSVVSTVSLSNTDKSNKIYFLGSDSTNLGNSYLANAVSGNYSMTESLSNQWIKIDFFLVNTISKVAINVVPDFPDRIIGCVLEVIAGGTIVSNRLITDRNYNTRIGNVMSIGQPASIILTKPSLSGAWIHLHSIPVFDRNDNQINSFGTATASSNRENRFLPASSILNTFVGLSQLSVYHRGDGRTYVIQMSFDRRLPTS
jgi:hypothetical protein